MIMSTIQSQTAKTRAQASCDKLAQLLHASETMRHELAAFMLYLEVSGRSSKALVNDYIKEHRIVAPVPKNEGLRLLAAFKEAYTLSPGVYNSKDSAESPDCISHYSEPGTTITADPSLSAGTNRKIYIEQDAPDYEITKRVISHFSGTEPVIINHYKDVFNVAGQDYSAQKESPSFILAVNRRPETYFYRGAAPCQSFGHEHFYYSSLVKNCLYDCEYCYLRGMYPSGNIVIFVNFEDYFNELEKMLMLHPVYLSIAYDTDLLALENLTGLLGRWSEFAGRHPELLLEVRTKCAADVTTITTKNIILAYTISPDPIASAFEHKAPGYEARKRAVIRSINAGIRTRLCFDPVIPVENCIEIYEAMLDDLFTSIQKENTRNLPLSELIEDVSVGGFRISRSYIKNMQKAGLSTFSTYPYTLKDGYCTFPPEQDKELIESICRVVSGYMGNDNNVFKSLI